jgi:hypothetical protein
MKQFIYTFGCVSAGKDNMKKILIILFAFFLPSCKDTPTQQQQPMGQVVAYVHWENQPLAGKQVELVQTGETKLTDSAGLAKFSLTAGKYVVRAFDINRGGPSPRYIDFDVEVHPRGKNDT